MPKMHWLPEMDAALVELYGTRQTIATIAAKIGVSDKTLQKRAKELGLERPKFEPEPKEPKPADPGKVLEFCDLIADGLSPMEAGRRLGYANGNSVLQSVRCKLGWQAS